MEEQGKAHVDVCARSVVAIVVAYINRMEVEL